MKKLFGHIIFLIIYIIAIFNIVWFLINKIDMSLQIGVIYKAESNDILQIFYTDGKTIKDFNETQSVKQNILGNDRFNNIQYSISTSNLDRLRLDIATKPCTIIIKEIKIKKLISNYTLNAEDIIKDFKNHNEISNIYIKDNLLYIYSSGDDPYIYAESMGNIIESIDNENQNIIFVFSMILSFIISLVLAKLTIYLIYNRAAIVQNIVIYFKNFYKYKGLLRELVIRDIKIKYRRSILGFLWSLLNPLLMMVVIYVVFSNLFRFDIKNFPIYLLTGQIFFNFFSESTSMAMGSIMANGSLIRKVYIPKYIFPVSKILSSFINLLFSLIAIIFMLFVTKVKISCAILFFPLSLLYLLIFAIGIGLILAAYAVFFRDLTYLYGILLMAWTYLTPIFYPVSIIPEKYKLFLKLNPMYYYIEHFRQVVLYGQIPSIHLNLICLTISVVTLLIGIFVFYKNQNKFILYI